MAIATTITALVKEEIDPAAMACQEELILDGHKIKMVNEEDSHTLGQFKTLKILSMNQTYLTSLAGLPSLPDLEVLELADNKLGAESSLEVISQRCPKLHTLVLAGNRLTDLTFLKGFNTLEVLDVDVNPITASRQSEMEVRAALFKEFPNLKVVNSRDREGNDVEDADSSSESDSDEESDSEQGPKIVGDDVEKKREITAPKTSLLKSFYEKEYDRDGADDDDDDEEDFNPDSFEDSDEENSEAPDEDEDDDNDEEANTRDATHPQSSGKVESVTPAPKEEQSDKLKPSRNVGRRRSDTSKQEVLKTENVDAASKKVQRKRKSEPQDETTRKKRI